MARKSRKKAEINDAIEPLIWQMASYSRISNEQDSLIESDSISSQRKLLSDYIEGQPDMILVNEYIDDGMTGTNFQRPAFSQLINDILAGKINGIVVKDLSRFGRNFEEAEEYLLKIFPFLNVRFISLNDDFDSEYKALDTILVGMKNLINDYYAKDVSQKVGSSIRILRQEGIYWGPRPPYGFLIKSDKKLRYLVKDPKTEPYIKQIFDKVEAGESYHQIVKWLELNKVIPPMRRSYELGLLKNERYKHLTRWYRSTIVNILKNPAYYGALPIAKSERSLWHNKPYRKLTSDEWVCISNTHEGYITKEQYQNIQKIVEQRTLQAKKRIDAAEKETKVSNMFAHKMYCGFCKQPLNRKYFRTRKGKRTYYFICGNHFNKAISNPCPSVYIQEKAVRDAVFRLIKNHIEHISNIEKIIKERQTKLQTGKKESYKMRLQQVDSSIMAKERMKQELYLDLKRGLLAEDEYLYMRDEYMKELKALQQEKKRAQKDVDRFCKEPGEVHSVVRIAKEFVDSIELDSKLMKIFIKHITVYSDNRIEIQLHMNDAFSELLENMEVLNEK